MNFQLFHFNLGGEEGRRQERKATIKKNRNQHTTNTAKSPITSGSQEKDRYSTRGKRPSFTKSRKLSSRKYGF